MLSYILKGLLKIAYKKYYRKEILIEQREVLIKKMKEIKATIERSKLKNAK